MASDTRHRRKDSGGHRAADSGDEEVTETKREHDWQPIDPGSKYYTCTRCHVSGKVTDHSWPPMRDPKFIAPEYRFCPTPEDTFWREMKEKYGVERD